MQISGQYILLSPAESTHNKRPVVCLTLTNFAMTIDFAAPIYRVDDEGYACFEVAWKGYHGTDTKYADTFITEDNTAVAERFYQLYPKMRVVKGTKTRVKEDDTDSEDDDESKENDTVVIIDEATAAFKVKLLDKKVQQTTTAPKKVKVKPKHKRKLSKASTQPVIKQVKTSSPPSMQVIRPIPSAPVSQPGSFFHSAPNAIFAAPLHPTSTHVPQTPPQWTPSVARTYLPPAPRPTAIEIIDVEQAAPIQSKTLYLS